MVHQTCEPITFHSRKAIAATYRELRKVGSSSGWDLRSGSRFAFATSALAFEGHKVNTDGANMFADLIVGHPGRLHCEKAIDIAQGYLSHRNCGHSRENQMSHLRLTPPFGIIGMKDFAAAGFQWKLSYTQLANCV